MKRIAILVLAACGDTAVITTAPPATSPPVTTTTTTTTTTLATTTTTLPPTTTTTVAPSTTTTSTTSTTSSTTTTTLPPEPHPAVVAEIDLGNGPCALEVEEDGFAWVTYLRDGHAARIDPATREEVDRVNTGPGACRIVVAGGALWVADGEQLGRVWVPNHSDGRLSVVDEATGELVDSVLLKRGICVAEPVGEEVWVTDFSARKIFVIDPALAGG